MEPVNGWCSAEKRGSRDKSLERMRTFQYFSLKTPQSSQKKSSSPNKLPVFIFKSLLPPFFSGNSFALSGFLLEQIGNMDYSSIFFFFFWPSLPGSCSVLLSHLLRVAVAAAQNATSSESQRRIPSWGSPADVPPSLFEKLQI